VALQDVGRRRRKRERVYSIINIDVSVDARERVHDPQEGPNLLLVSIFPTLGGNESEQIPTSAS